ncbi:hypothetical protein [Streptomyces aureus]|uniref:hypothetical protein n=1 Tax=Streptomyces aureus TaxID=193461 RepID=UPI0033F7C247
MSVIVEFFTAPDDTSAASVLQAGPGSSFESLSFGNFDPEEALIEWECLLRGASFEGLVEAGEPRVVVGRDDDECVVFEVAPRLSAALADVERSTLARVAASWVAMRAEDGETIDADVADLIFVDLAALADKARLQGHRIYCWVA